MALGKIAHDFSWEIQDGGNFILVTGHLLSEWDAACETIVESAAMSELRSIVERNDDDYAWMLVLLFGQGGDVAYSVFGR